MIIVQSGTTTSRRGRAREREKNSFNLIRVGEEWCASPTTCTSMTRAASPRQPAHLPPARACVSAGSAGSRRREIALAPPEARPAPARSGERNERVPARRCWRSAAARSGAARAALGALRARPPPRPPRESGSRIARRWWGWSSRAWRASSGAAARRHRHVRQPLPSIQALCLVGGVPRRAIWTDQLQMDRARVELYYYQRGFRESTVVVDTLPVDDGVRVLFTVTRGCRCG